MEKISTLNNKPCQEEVVLCLRTMFFLLKCNDENNSGVYVTLIPNIALTLGEARLPHDSEQDAAWFHST